MLFKNMYSFNGSVGKESTCNAGDPGSIPGSGGSPGEGIGYPLQYSWASCGSAGRESICLLWPFLFILSSNDLHQDILYPGLQKFLNSDNYCSTGIQLRSTFGFRSYQYGKKPQGVRYH